MKNRYHIILGDIAFRILKYKAVSPDFRKSIFPNFDLNSKLPLERKIAENEVEAQYQGFEDKLNDPQNSKETEPCSRYTKKFPSYFLLLCYLLN